MRVQRRIRMRGSRALDLMPLVWPSGDRGCGRRDRESATVGGSLFGRKHASSPRNLDIGADCFWVSYFPGLIC